MEIFADSGQLHGFVGEKKEKEDDISRLIARLSKGNGGEILATASPPQRLLSKLSRCSVAVSKLILSRNLLDRRPLAPLESSRYPREDVPSGNALHSCYVSLGLREYFGVSREIRSSLFLSLYLSLFAVRKIGKRKSRVSFLLGFSFVYYDWCACNLLDLLIFLDKIHSSNLSNR